MTPEFLAAVIDTLLPGDDVLPSGTAAGILPPGMEEAHRSILDAIAAEAGGIAAFVHAGESTRAAVVGRVERTAPDRFRALLVALSSDYYESATVLTALGWRIEAPQPAGHSIPHGIDTMAPQLERVRSRGKLWRG